MKTIIYSILILSLALIAPLDSTAKDDDSVKYEVTISVVYNAVGPVEASRIARVAMIDHKEACKVDVQVKKVTSGMVRGEDYIIYDGNIDLTQEEYDRLMGQ
jgi:uncharacterized protein YdaL